MLRLVVFFLGIMYLRYSSGWWLANVDVVDRIGHVNPFSSPAIMGLVVWAFDELLEIEDL